MDLKKKHEDYDVLTVVTKACVENIPDADGRPGMLIFFKSVLTVYMYIQKSIM